MAIGTPVPSRRRVTPARVALGAGVMMAAALAIMRDADAPAVAQIAVRNQGYVPYSEAPINYRSQPLNDPVALLQKELDTGKVKLAYDDTRGYLPSVLKALNIPVNSQTLVFSKTSFQFTKISPDHPRALYYNDDVYIGSVHQGKTVEVVSFDPMQGAIFYLLDDVKTARPTFQRAELDCTQCHIAAATRGVPGVFMRSVYPSQTGALTPRAPQYITDQKSAIKDRWGGWYVNGSLAKGTMANQAVVAKAVVAAAPPPIGQTSARPIPDLGAVATPYDRAAYLAPGSDQVALLVLGHQTQMHNLITLTNYQTRLALFALGKGGATPTLDSLPPDAQDKIKRPAEQLLRHLLFAEEVPLGGIDARQAIADSAFARDFATRGPRDARKRSLRDFDLHDRLFRYPCSYLIYSSAFDALPELAKGYVYHRLLQILTGQDQSADFDRLSAQDRQAILSILLETKSGLPGEWADYARANHLRLAAR